MSYSPIQYTSRTYNTILNDINSAAELKDKPEWFKRMIAGVGDMLSMINNASANQSYLRTAFTRRAVADLLELVDYYMMAQTASSGVVLFYLNTAVTYPVTFTLAELVGYSQGNISQTSMKFEALSGSTVASVTDTFTHANPNNYLTVTADIVYTGVKVRFTTGTSLPTGLSTGTDYYLARLSATQVSVATSLANALAGSYIDLTAAGAGVGIHTLTMYSFSKTLYQQATKSTATIGTSDGSTAWQTFDLPDKLIIGTTLVIVVGGTTYTQVTTLITSGATDTDYLLKPKSDGSFYIQFGDGTYGIIPPAGSITATYAVGGGSTTNISNLNKITIYSGGNANIAGMANVTTFTGGADEQSIENAKILAPLLLKARDRFVTAEDGEALTLAYGGVAYCKVNANEYGVLTCQVLGIANGGGNPSGGLRTAIQTYLIDRSILSSIDVRFETATLTAPTVTSAIKVKTGYVYATILPYIRLAWKLFYTEAGKEIVDTYDADGITDTITLINTIMSTAFSTTDAYDISQITRLVENLEYRTFGETIQSSDAFAYIQSNVYGIDYITITLPAYPVTYASDEISTHTAITLNLSAI